MIETYVSDPIYVISAHGEWDVQNAPAMSAALDQATTGRWPFVFVDLSEVPFMDVAGSRPLRDAIHRCRPSRVRLFVVHASSLITTMLQVLDAGDAIAAMDRRDRRPLRAASAS